MATTTTTKNNFTVSVASGQTYNLTGSDDTITLASNDLSGVYGAGDHVIATGAGDSVWLGANGQLSTGAAIDTINFYQGGSLYEMGSSNVTLVGSHVKVTVNDWDTLAASGGAINFTASGPGAIVSIGGDGVYASNADEDTGTFATGGTLTEYANSRVDITGSNVAATLMGDDTFGLYGSGETILSAGAAANSYVWVGENGQNASAANVDLVTLTNGGTIFELANSNISVVGSHIAITMSSDDTLTLLPITNTNFTSGYDDTITATGMGDVVYANASGQDLGSDNWTVNFQHGGTLYLGYAATVTATGNNVTATVGLSGGAQFMGNNNLTMIGSGDTVNFVTPANPEYVTIGGNGRNATGAAIDTVNAVGPEGGAIIVAVNSTVRVNLGSTRLNATTTLSGDDTLFVTGLADVSAFATGNAVNLSSNGQNSATPQFVSFEIYNPVGENSYASGVLNLQSNANVDELAANASVTLFSNDTLEIGGGGGNVVRIAASSAATNNIVNIDATGPVDANGLATGVTTVNVLSPNTVTTGDVIDVNFGATGVVNASHTIVKAINATATVNGLADIVESNPYISGGTYDYEGNVLTVGGNGLTALGGGLANADAVWLGDFDTLTVENNATLILTPNSADVATIGQTATVDLGANDYVALTGTYALFAPAKTGSDVVTGFGGADTLKLTSTFANSAALLAATTYAAGNATIHLDANDAITLAAVSQTTFASDVAAGRVKV